MRYQEGKNQGLEGKAADKGWNGKVAEVFTNIYQWEECFKIL